MQHENEEEPKKPQEEAKPKLAAEVKRPARPIFKRKRCCG
jgi:hypothetical protein